MTGGWHTPYRTRKVWHRGICDQDGPIYTTIAPKKPSEVLGSTTSLMAPMTQGILLQKVCVCHSQSESFPLNPRGPWPGPPPLVWQQSSIKGSCWAMGHGACWPWPAPSALNELNPAQSTRCDLEVPVSVTIRAWNWKIQDSSIWENSFFTKTQAILKNHLEIHACSNISSVSEPSLESRGWGREENTVGSFIPGCTQKSISTLEMALRSRI